MKVKRELHTIIFFAYGDFRDIISCLTWIYFYTILFVHLFYHDPVAKKIPEPL